MKRILAFAVSCLVLSCQSEPTLQKYFVQQADDPGFVTLDISPSVLNIDNSKLSVAQKEAFKSFDRMNILAFKATDSNAAEFEAERAKVAKILQDPKYQQLVKIGSGKEGASVSFVGQDEHIDEFVVFANQKDNGFAVVRVLGNDMNPTSIVTMVTALQNADLDLKQLEPLQQFLKN